MIDIHSHVLWGLDDGVSTLQDSVTMLKEAFQAGTTDIVATPHANTNYRFDPPTIAERIAELEGLGEQLPRLHRGCDFHLSPENLEDVSKEPSKYTINGRQYLLVELPDVFLPQACDAVLARLQYLGVVPVITHPERNPVLHQDRNAIARWVASGCLVQITGLALLGRFGKTARETGWRIIESGWAHFIASDAHHPRDRHAKLDEVYQAVERRLGSETAEELLEENPAAVISGGEVLPVKKPGRRWYRLWR